jgi:putative oxidoreductase
MARFCLKCCDWLNRFQWLSLLLFRLTLAYGFLMASMHKFQHFDQTVKWFGSQTFPCPKSSVILVGTTELLGAILLFLGLFTRLISIPLLFVMGVAIFVVHWKFGFEAANNGFEIPFYYALMLLTLLTTGPGKVSLDAWIKKKCMKMS